MNAITRAHVVAETLHGATTYPEPCVTLHAFLVEALEYEREAFEEDTEVEGAHLVEWFSEWRNRVQAELIALQVYGPREAEAGPPEAFVSVPREVFDEVVRWLDGWNDDTEFGGFGLADKLRGCGRE